LICVSILNAIRFFNQVDARFMPKLTEDAMLRTA